MDKIKRYIECFVPITTCTLRCHYCYIVQNNLFNSKIHKFKYSPDTLKKALSKERLGGTCLVNFCAAGETLLSNQILDYIKAVLEEGHYVMVVTNATISARFDEIISFSPELLNRLFFKFSYHYIELTKKNLLERFFENIKKVRDAGCSFTLEVTPCDELIPLIDEMNQRAFIELGGLPHFTIARDERDPERLPILTSMSREKYIETWGRFESPIFDYKLKIFEVKRNEFCYAGDWSFWLNIGTGMMRQCYASIEQHNILDDVSKPIPFHAIGNNCQEHHCYNGHSFIVLGDIPELKSPVYADLRNRICADGSEWLKPDMKIFMSSKLYESNDEYTYKKKVKVNKRAQRIILKREIAIKVKLILGRFLRK